MITGIWLHIPLGRDTTNLCHGMVLMNLSHTLACDLAQWCEVKGNEVNCLSGLLNDLITSVL